MNNKIKFPVGTPDQWTTSDDVCIPDAHLRNWLLDTGSLTERLQSHCRQFELRLLGQRQMEPELEELQRLEIRNTESAHDWQVREVVLFGDGKPWVYARSVLPNALCQTDLVDLGDKPLGQIIFNDPRFKRSPFEVCMLSNMLSFKRKLNVQDDAKLWGRRSIFQYLQFNMMVAEIFLPDAPAYKTMTEMRKNVNC